MEYYSVVTTLGAEKIADCIVSGAKLNINTAVAGDGNGTEYEPTISQTTLINEKWRGEIASAALNPSAANMLDVKIVIDDTDEPFTVREIGILSEDGTLIAVCNVPKADKELPANGASNKLIYVMHITVADSSVVNITINPALAGVTADELKAAIDAHDSADNPHPGKFATLTHKHTATDVGAATTASYKVDIPNTAWTEDTTNGGYYKTVTVNGILANDEPIADVVLGTDIIANAQALDAWACITRITTAEDSIKLWANDEAPTVAFTIQLKVVR